MALESIGGQASLLDVTYGTWCKHNNKDSQATVEPHVLQPTNFGLDIAEQKEKILADEDDVRRIAKQTAASTIESGDNSNEKESTTQKKDRKVLLDARERLNFLSGHIPGATNIPSLMLYDYEHDKILQSIDNLRRLFGNRDLHPPSSLTAGVHDTSNGQIHLITYCGSAGTLSGLLYYALLHAGFPRRSVKMYDAAFHGWKSDESNEIEVQPDANYWDLSAE